MAEKKHILTYAGLKQYEDELQDLKVNRRREVAQKIKEAREQGDLSENAEYDAAKDEQRDIELRIEELEKLLKNAEVVDEDEIDLDKISIGCKVRVYDVDFILDHSGLSLHINHISRLFTHKSLTYRRLVRNLILQAVCLSGAYNTELHFLIKVLEIQRVS